MSRKDKNVTVRILNDEFIGEREAWLNGCVTVSLRQCEGLLRQRILQAVEVDEIIEVEWRIEDADEWQCGAVNRCFSAGPSDSQSLMLVDKSFNEDYEVQQKMNLKYWENHVGIESQKVPKEAEKVQCDNCGFLILRTTAVANEGMCAVCAKGGEGPGFDKGPDPKLVAKFLEYESFIMRCQKIAGDGFISWCITQGMFVDLNGGNASPGDCTTRYGFFVLGSDPSGEAIVISSQDSSVYHAPFSCDSNEQVESEDWVYDEERERLFKGELTKLADSQAEFIENWESILRDML